MPAASASAGWALGKVWREARGRPGRSIARRLLPARRLLRPRKRVSGRWSLLDAAAQPLCTAMLPLHWQPGEAACSSRAGRWAQGTHLTSSDADMLQMVLALHAWRLCQQQQPCTQQWRPQPCTQREPQQHPCTQRGAQRHLHADGKLLDAKCITDIQPAGMQLLDQVDGIAMPHTPTVLPGCPCRIFSTSFEAHITRCTCRRAFGDSVEGLTVLQAGTQPTPASAAQRAAPASTSTHGEQSRRSVEWPCAEKRQTRSEASGAWDAVSQQARQASLHQKLCPASCCSDTACCSRLGRRHWQCEPTGSWSSGGGGSGGGSSNGGCTQVGPVTASHMPEAALTLHVQHLLPARAHFTSLAAAFVRRSACIAFAAG